jgi:hypothetical protein
MNFQQRTSDENNLKKTKEKRKRVWKISNQLPSIR